MSSGSFNDARRFSPSAALFDMDGLMLDTERPAVRLWLEVSREAGFPMAESVPVSTIGLDEKSTRELVLRSCGPHFPYDEIRAEVESRYFRLMEESGTLHRPGLLSILEALSARRIPMAVATSTPRAGALVKLERAGILGYFGALACGDEVERGKPSPDIFLLAATRLGVHARDCVGFEDSPAGLRALASAGIRSVFVKDCVEPPAEVLSSVWLRCSDLSEAALLFTAADAP